MTNFPAIAPTRRSYTAPKFPTKRFDSISGAGVTRLYGSKSFGAQLQLEFNQNDEGTRQFLDCYEAARGNFGTLNLPAQIFDGMTAELQASIPNQLSWRFAGTPQVESLFPNRSRIRVTLAGTLDV
jgi:hypothetical protein|tara:strand:+ start:79 stop:456 length:378 start_codon:yes stop_codon:yes gene_type:complete